MRTLAIAMQKGGSGKTTTAVNLAAAFAERGRRVLLVDCDPQGNASTWLAAPDDDGRGLYGVLCEGASLKAAIRETSAPGVSIVPASRWLIGAERALVGEVGAETILRRKLRDVAGAFDLALVDTPPTLGVLTIGALVAADYALVPCEAHALALHGLAQLLSTVATVRERLNERLAIAAIVPCRVDARTRHGQEIADELRRRFPKEASSVSIRESVRLAEAPSFGQSIFAYDPKGAGAEDYRALAAEIAGRVAEI